MAEKLRTLDFGDGKGARVLAPDWENVDNKPFYEGIVTLIDNQTFTELNDDGTMVITPTVELVEGAEYTIIYNGAEYKTTAIAFKDLPGFGSGVAVGNGAAFGFPNTGEPFIIGYAGGISSVIPLDGSTEVVLTVIGEGIKKIDAKYVAPTYFYAGDDKYIYMDEARITKASAHDILALKDGDIRIKGSFNYGTNVDGQIVQVPIPFISSVVFIADYANVEGYVMCMIPGLSGTTNALYTSEYVGQDDD